MKIFIEPNDVLMFRDGRPFSGGDDHFAKGMFPPAPATFYGAVRSKILSEKYPEYDSFRENKIPDSIKAEIGTPTSDGTLSITNFMLAKRSQSGNIIPLFSTPRDLLRVKGEESKYFLLRPEETVKNNAKINLPNQLINLLWFKTEKVLEEIGGFLDLMGMEEYLLGNTPLKIIETQDIYLREERTGIKKNRIRRAVETGALYSVEYFRLKEDIGLLVELEGTINFPAEGLLRIGGDHRSAHYKKVDCLMPDLEKIKAKVLLNKHFKLILTTPAIFQKGWLPSWINEDSLEGVREGIRLKMISAAIGRPIGLGGFDLAKKIPKAMKKAVPAGSVYYFEIEDGSLEGIFDIFWLKSISDEKSKEGFGITLIGGY